MNDGTGQRIAVLGLGIIGSRVLSRLAGAGFDASGWNRTPKGLPGETGNAAHAVEGADIVSLFLRDAVAVREVVAALENVWRPGQIVMNHSTVDLATTEWLAGFFAGRGCRFLDAPFTGSKLAARDGKILYYLGGDEDLIAAVDAVLAASGHARMRVGDVGSATVIKLATNLISACSVQAMAEAMAITTRQGIDPQRLIEAVAGNASGSPLAAMKLAAMAGRDFDTHFSLANMAKDGRYALALAEAAGLETPAIGAVSRRMKELCDQGLGELDYAALASPYLD